MNRPNSSEKALIPSRSNPKLSLNALMVRILIVQFHQALSVINSGVNGGAAEELAINLSLNLR
ncbi:hypothetical protein IFO70_28935 [Phormidium tenue FACHB-886]|nr:hypothetical protein [Phormidium tenue FACHB-886]